ncbi:uncharacterized protein LOC141873254 isoform X1 [Acropora palmata]|uniref:uncharacterized protein LOC141873254 isoform X1 n=1 Tax=Acropora palmata TaxID=6131 RepID=UPI003DA149DE
MSNDLAPKGRYKPAIIMSRQSMPMTNSKLSEGYLRSFGFANTNPSSKTESSEDNTQQTEVTDDTQLKSETSSQAALLPCSKDDNVTKEQHSILSESQINMLSFNLWEIADKISPNKYDIESGLGEKTLESLVDGNNEMSSQTFGTCNDEQTSRFKTPYSRQCRGSKTFASRQKSFTRKKLRDNHGSQQELNNNDGISVDPSKVLSLANCNSDMFKQDSESDSGYSSSMSASVSLSEDIEALKRLSLENGSSTDIETDDFMSSKNCNDTTEISADNHKERTDRASSLSSVYKNASHVCEDRLNSSPGDRSSNNADHSFKENPVFKSDSQKLNGIDEPSCSSILSHENSPPLEENTDEKSNKIVKSTSNSQKVSSDDMALPRTKTGRKLGSLRRRTTLVSFRPPKQMTVMDGESDIVEMDEAGFMQMLTDLKSFKTQLLKLKRELQEAEVVSPLTLSHSPAAKTVPLGSEFDSLERKTPQRKRMLSRTITMDATTLRQRLGRTPLVFSGDGFGNLKNVTDSTNQRNQTPEPNAGASEELRNLHEELKSVKDQLFEITKERDSVLIAREELEHELDSKNHTIRMLQKQLESQSDNQDEMAYLKRQVKSLTNQIEQQQQRITELRFRSSSPSPLPVGTISKETVKADIRNRLRDAFVKHLGEYSKTHVQLSKYIQKAEQNISMAQKGLSSFFSSPHASTEHLSEDKSRPSLKRSDSQSSVEKEQEDSDDRGSESDSSKSYWRRYACSSDGRNNEDSGSECGKPLRRSTSSLSQDEVDKRERSDSDCAKLSRRSLASPSFIAHDGTDRTNTDSKMGSQFKRIENSRSRKSSAQAPRVRKLSRSKMLSKIEASPLSHSWTPGAIEKIVMSWREKRAPAASQEKTKGEKKPKLSQVSHVEFFETP